MLRDIDKQPIYREVLSEYGDDPNYQKDGKRDIRKLKKEAMAKQLAIEAVNQGSWWGRVLEFIKSLLQKVGFNPFEKEDAFKKTARSVMEGNVDANANLNNEAVFLLQIMMDIR